MDISTRTPVKHFHLNIFKADLIIFLTNLLLFLFSQSQLLEPPSSCLNQKLENHLWFLLLCFSLSLSLNTPLCSGGVFLNCLPQQTELHERWDFCLFIFLPLDTKSVCTVSKFCKCWMNCSFKKRSSIIWTFVHLLLFINPGMDLLNKIIETIWVQESKVLDTFLNRLFSIVTHTVGDKGLDWEQCLALTIQSSWDVGTRLSISSTSLSYFSILVFPFSPVLPSNFIIIWAGFQHSFHTIVILMW